jgi:hypothetical protein
MTVTAVYVLNTHRWLYSRLTEDTEPDGAYRLSWTIDEADILIMPVRRGQTPALPSGESLSASPASLSCICILPRIQPVLVGSGLFIVAPATGPRREMCRVGFHVARSHYEPAVANKLTVRNDETVVDACADIRSHGAASRSHRIAAPIRAGAVQRGLRSTLQHAGKAPGRLRVSKR